MDRSVKSAKREQPNSNRSNDETQKVAKMSNSDATNELSIHSSGDNKTIIQNSRK